MNWGADYGLVLSFIGRRLTHSEPDEEQCGLMKLVEEEKIQNVVREFSISVQRREVQ